jgi:GH24 family phage-related lysozyme (muramidase)
MHASTHALGLIVKFEGLELEAYRDPGGTPTIGYGTTVYPNGVKVRLGDGISANEAHEYLAFDVARFAKGVSDKVADLPLNQNQFDALVSFSYNEGLAAFAGSTLLTKLRAGDIKGAAAEFPRWNKATVGGVLKVLPGLVTRRAAEQALFEAAPGKGAVGAATPIGPSSEPQPAAAGGVADGAAAALAAAAPVPVPGKNYLRLTRTTGVDHGLTLLQLTYVKNGVSQGHILVYSGAPNHQVFRKGKDSHAGSLEPLPEGRWFVHDIQWRDGKDNYTGKVFSAGLGPVSIPLDYKAPGTTARSAIEIHIDFNKATSPGTAGCLGVRTVNDYKTLVRWLRDTDPRGLFVNYGLGSCPNP